MKTFFSLFAFATLLTLPVTIPSVARADIAPDPTPYIQSSQPVHYVENEEGATVPEAPRLTIEENILLQFPRALYLSIIIEVIVAAVILAARKLNRRILFSVPIATLVTLPLLWWIILEHGTSMPYIVAGEVLVIAIEAAILYSTQRPLRLSAKHAMLISITMNVISVLIGFAITS